MKSVNPRFVRAQRLAVVSLALFGLALTQAASPALAEESREEVAEAQEQAAARVDALESEIEDIDANLAQVFLDLTAANEKIPVAQQAVEEATARRDTANREHEIALGQLTAARGQQDALNEEVAQAQARQQDANDAIGDLARRMYQNGSSSAVVLALTKSGTETIDQRASAADAMARTQSQALNAAIDIQTTQRTQLGRQQAITDRIAALEDQAARSLDDAKTAEAQAQAGLEELERAKAEAQVKQAEWDSKKSELDAQLAQAQADYEERTARLQQIDAENRSNGRYYVSSAGFTNPVLPQSMVITSPFGWRFHPVLGYEKYHSGVDLAAQCGEPVFAAADGVVSHVGSDYSAGNYVDVSHGIVGGNSVISEYLHMQAIYVSAGQSVSAGTILGEVGMTGYATGCHLHFGILQNGVNVDPMGYL
ncbi:peptidoglycan DD-metalloendopeptidase family protein [Schaalia cardiffensis]|uniref:peptidoglycan DD-metalloendopeptidase family protein n=1 Tax=Schaalia cardiffensis TaxID=181487 RepID=UPI0018E74EB1|nr:M23 family metallopeptidase [Schaalia cardiffensis]MBJ2329254.1 peptidoglycan DD-metalloendopeptidase family protein [Schaalia cardiffensis]